MLDDGDLIFVRDEKEMSQAIQTSTGTYNHVAIYVDGEVFHAVPDTGVVSQAPSDFFRQDAVYDLYYYPDIDLTEVKKQARSYLGRPYNPSFYPDTEGFYCSEYIARILPIFETIPMSFRDGEQEVSPFWQDYYQQLELEVPVGVAGTNPSQLAASPALVFKERYTDDSTTKPNSLDEDTLFSRTDTLS